MCVVNIAAPDLPAPLLQEQGMIPCLKICPDLESCEKVRFDNTGCHPVLPCGKSRDVDFQPCLLDWQAGDSLRQDLGCFPKVKVP